MKYEKKSLNHLCDLASSLIRYSFESFKLSSDDLNCEIEKFYEDHFFTNNGNKRYPVYYKTCVSMVIDQIRKKYFNDCLIFCYRVDGRLYTTFNSENRSKYYFKGNTDIPNYKIDPVIVEKINNGNYSESGFFFPCGKPYYINNGY